MRATSNEGKDYVYQEWGDVAWVWGEPVRWTNWFKGDGLNRASTKGYFQGISSAKQISRDYNSSNMGGKTWFGPGMKKRGCLMLGIDCLLLAILEVVVLIHGTTM